MSRMEALSPALEVASRFMVDTRLRHSRFLGVLANSTLQTFVSHQCYLRFRVYRYHCGFSRQLPRENVLTPLGNKSQILENISGESECLGIF